LKVSQLISLVSRASNGKIDISNGAVGYKGYGFVFLDTVNSNSPYCKLNGGHILARIGSQDNNLEFLFPNSNGFS